MEEVDNIIIHSLRSIGCSIDESVESLHQFNTEVIVEAAVKCLRVISGLTELPTSLPPGMSARFRLGTTLAQALTDLGYRGEIGYQTFLYSNEADIRRVFMFLVDKLPRESGEAVEETLGASLLLQRAISAELARRLSGPWSPPYCKTNNLVLRGKPAGLVREGCSASHRFLARAVTVPTGCGDLSKKIPKEVKAYYSKDLPLVSHQPLHKHELAPSLLEKNVQEVTSQQEWELEWNQQGLASRLTQQEYKARKKQRLQKRIADQLRQGVQRGEAAASGTADLMQLVNSMSDKGAATSKTKGSRFTHTEKLQFAQV
ncbi:coiled-coil domain-containing protein 22 homolog [Lingula anatina]|uniref:Coiled-coil domain-containing protein 22 homolog n=1 Tax=Lingula anatina TaxID=7574 RepID=A0A1S3JLE9_LINAN|nr:coiled-coil domain-containing protein 22 homolog [Lingula anatina]|eukprot:XP_013411235.1 coiled-coil domain-containing protein 22 homolog [Lingula anatina]